MNGTDNDERQAFVIWMRSGRGPNPAIGDGIERKHNPWHDPDDGRFTFAHRGRYFAPSGGGFRRIEPPPVIAIQPRAGAVSGRATPAADRAQKVARRTAEPPSGAWAGGGFTGGGGGRFGGGGATATAPWPQDRSTGRRSSSPRLTPIPSPSVVRPGGRAPVPGVPSIKPPEDQRHAIVRNGYTFEVDGRGRTRRVRGVLTLAETPVRSRSVQKRAGGAERRPTDDGGHYIAARFDGPAEAFNHFAQNAGANRGKYRAIEDQWARSKRAGRQVTVRIAPEFDGGSRRPAAVNLWRTIDGKPASDKVRNDGRR